jgi:hypothetical protein
MTDIIVPRRREDFFKPNGDPTLRFVRWMELVTEGGNDSAQIIEDDTGIIGVNAQILAIRRQVGSGVPVTVDTTGFTVDTTFQFADMDEV